MNATVETARLIDAEDRELATRLRFRPHQLCPTGPTVNVGVMANAGVYFGVYPGRAELACDIRTLPGMSEADLVGDVERFLADKMVENPRLDANLEWVATVPACDIDRDEPIVAALRAAAREVLPHEPRLDAFPGALRYFGSGRPTDGGAHGG